MTVRAIRGATTLSADSEAEMGLAVVELLEAIIEANALDLAEIISITFTATPDIHCQFPATAARKLKPEILGNVPLLCAQEMDVPGALPLTIRTLIHVNTEEKQATMRHQYLRGAVVLRPDIAQ
jgi:chorismate mutase